MKILVIGDVVGKPGRVALLERLQDLKEHYAIDFTTMNAENAAAFAPVDMNPDTVVGAP